MTAASGSMSLLGWTLLGLLSLLWGGSFFFVEIAVTELPAFTIVFVRVALAAVTLHLILIAMGRRLPLTKPVVGAFLTMGFLNNLVPFSLLVWGQASIASGLASILNATTPLFTVLVAHVVTEDERLTPARVAGVLLGLAGVVVMIGPDALDGVGEQVLAQMACLGAGLSYGFAAVFGRRFRGLGLTPVETATGQVTASSLLLLPLVLMIDRPWHLPLPSTGSIVALAALATLSTALAYLLYFRVLALGGATNVSLVTLLVPVSAIALGILFLGETFELSHAIGLVLIGFGLAAIDGRALRLLAQRPA
ncbi:MAG: DMT family transporter [Geminicoccaceae bacterium]